MSIVIPTIYRPQAEAGKAHAIDKECADNYLRHTTFGDPQLDPVMEQMHQELAPDDVDRFIRAGIEGEEQVMREAPQYIRDFFEVANEPPEWLDYKAFEPGARVFSMYVETMLVAFVTGVLVEGFATTIAKSFNMTGRVGATSRRLMQNNRQVMEIFYPGGLQRKNDGWKLSVRVRFVHARVRNLLSHFPDWDQEAWGTPLSAANMGLSISVFSKRLVDNAKMVGARMTEEQEDSVIATWRYAGHLMGIPDSILYETRADAEQIYQVGHTLEPPPDENSVVMANLLINSIPKVAGFESPKMHKKIITLAYRLSRALIGDELADALEYPKTSRRTIKNTILLFRLKQYIGFLLKNQQVVRAGNFLQMFQISLYDEGGISYRMPDKVRASESRDW